ncbi:hypothetical protein ACSAM2_11420 [Actinomyces oris]|uniref:hypothetical protein n=1 Tax=Actinomyces TaxID=1654 RepID=UPI0008070810|nr:hypothetical protein [Actinomyces oris]OBY93945.1 hypothetical protein BBG13_03600 [Actinomyces oris]
MTTPRPVDPAIVARAVNSRLRVGRLTQAGQAITLTQTDATTCGPTCLLAAHLLLVPGERAAVTDDLAQEMTASPPGREGKHLLSVLSRQQLRLQRAMNVRGLGVLPWPKALGSTPWSVARQMTGIASTCTPGGGRRRYTVRWVSDRGPAWGGEVASIRDALASGLPVILVAGGPLVLDDVSEGEPTARARLRTSLARTPAVPRHYVLALPWQTIGQDDPGEGRAHIYEPSSGSVRALDLTAPRDPRRPGPRELGNWPRVLAVIAPEN